MDPALAPTLDGLNWYDDILDDKAHVNADPPELPAVVIAVLTLDVSMLAADIRSKLDAPRDADKAVVNASPPAVPASVMAAVRELLSMPMLDVSIL